MLIHSSDVYRRRDSINNGHDDVHENEIVTLGVLVYNIRRLLAIFLHETSAPSTTTWGGGSYSKVDGTLDLRKKLGTYPRANLVVLDQEDPWFLAAP